MNYVALKKDEMVSYRVEVPSRSIIPGLGFSLHSDPSTDFLRPDLNLNFKTTLKINFDLKSLIHFFLDPLKGLLSL